MGVAPWDLVERPVAWRSWALAAETIEAQVREARQQQGTMRP